MNKRSKIFLLFLLGLFISVPVNVSAASIVVNSACSLANAITAANADTATGGCDAGSGADTISFAADQELAEQLPEITIEGHGYSIRGNDNFTVLTVSSGSNLTLNRVTIMGGYGTTVGGVMNYGALTVKNSTITNNSGLVAGAVWNSGALKLIHSTISENSGGFVGGVLFSGGSRMEIYNSLLADNTNGDCFGGVNGSSGNLIVNGSCGEALTNDPLLGALTGSVRHYPLQAGSPAIDAADGNHCLLVDQLARPRPQGARCDIGAVKYQAASIQPAATDTSVPTLTNTPTDIPTSTNTPTATDTPAPTDTPTPKPGCVNVGPDTYWLFPSSNFLSGSITVYDNNGCHDGNTTQQDIGAAGYVYSADGQSNAATLCTTAHGGTAYTAQQQAFNTDVWQCALPATDTPLPSATNTPVRLVRYSVDEGCHCPIWSSTLAIEENANVVGSHFGRYSR